MGAYVTGQVWMVGGVCAWGDWLAGEYTKVAQRKPIEEEEGMFDDMCLGWWVMCVVQGSSGTRMDGWTERHEQ